MSFFSVSCEKNNHAGNVGLPTNQPLTLKFMFLNPDICITVIWLFSVGKQIRKLGTPLKIVDSIGSIFITAIPDGWALLCNLFYRLTILMIS